MSKTPEILGNLFVSIIKVIGQGVLIAILVVARILSGLLKLIITWLENLLQSSDKH